MHTQWTLQNAKNKFCEVVSAACAISPQIVTKRGTPTVVILSMSMYAQLVERTKAPVPRFAEFLLSMPADDNTNPAPRKDIALRDVDF